MAIKVIDDKYLVDIADAIRSKTGTEDTYKPTEMADAINSITTGSGGGGVELSEKVLSGSYEMRGFNNGGKWDDFIEAYPNAIKTNDLRYCNDAFCKSTLSRIPIIFNFPAIGTSNSCEIGTIFWECKNLLELPDMTGRAGARQMVCASCYNIRNIPDSWKTVEWVALGKWSSCRNFFQGCYSLRSIPVEVVRSALEVTGNSSSYYMGIFESCYSLDEIVGFRGSTGTLTENIMLNMFDYCCRLSRMVFDMENGSPLVRNWQNQTIDLSNYVGWVYSYSINRILNYNSGITADKEVKDATTYQALKNNPDWFSIMPEYSRYNRISAVETINSLPDCISSGGTNTIKFKGVAGSLTDGGAINTLTEEEIAVATAKGWTVSFV